MNVKSAAIESPELVATRIRAAPELVSADRLVINPDRGLRNLNGVVARAKLAAMVASFAAARAELRTTQHDTVLQGA